MKIITGGAFQGKRSFAKRLYPDVEWTDGGRCALDEIRTCRALYHFHEFVKRWLRQGRGWEDLAALILEENRGLILICDEIGCGLVRWTLLRGNTGEHGQNHERPCRAGRAVDRVVCGIGRRIK